MAFHGMKYQSIEMTELSAHLSDDGHWLEQKMDGVHVMAHVLDGEVKFRTVTGRPIGFAAAAQWLRPTGAIVRELGRLPNCTIEGELMIHVAATHSAGVFFVFDLPEMAGIVDKTTKFSVRRIALERLFELVAFTAHIKLVEIARTPAEKTDLWNRIIESGAEGGVFKKHYMPYRPGPKRTSAVLKCKRTTTIDAVVMARNEEGKENARLGLFRDGQIVEVGRCSMIGKPDAKVGEVVEVECLHVSDDDRLYQPRMWRIRRDKLANECRWDQLEAGRVNRSAA